MEDVARSDWAANVLISLVHCSRTASSGHRRPPRHPSGESHQPRDLAATAPAVQRRSDQQLHPAPERDRHECANLRPGCRDQRTHHPRVRRNPQPGSGGLRRWPAAHLRRSPHGTAGVAGDAAEGFRRRQAAGFPAGDPVDPRRQLDLCQRAPGHPGQARRDYRTRRPEDDHQRTQLRCQRVHGRFRGRQYTEVGQQHPGAPQPAGCNRRQIDYVSPEERTTSSVQRPPRCSCGRAVGICPKSTSRSTARRFPAASSTSPCISSTTRRR